MNDLLKIAKYWAMEPDFLRSLYKESLSTKSEKTLDNNRSISIRDGTAIIPIHGVVTARSDFFSFLSGGTSLADLSKNLQTALDDDQVNSILLDIDSPGGVAIGPLEMAEMIFNARSKKPIWSYVGRNGSSAAYWLASAAEKIVVHPSALLGSIGVVTTIPVQEESDSEGYKNIEIVSSNAALKRPDPRTKEGMAEIKRELDDIESQFINSIARYRNITPEVIKRDFGQGGVLIGENAVSQNMADSLGTYEDTLSKLNQTYPITNNNKIMANKEISGDQISTKDITANYIKSEFPDIAKSLINEASSSIEQQAFEKGATSERERILAIESTALPGHEDLIKAAKLDRSITAEKLALQIISAEKQRSSNYLSNLKESENELPKVAANIETEPKANKESNPNLPLENRAKSEWEDNPKIRAEFSDDYDSYFAYKKANENQQVKILSNIKTK